MTLKEAFKELTSRRNWYEGSGISTQVASDAKRRFKKGEIGDENMRQILIKCGWKSKEDWSN